MSGRSESNLLVLGAAPLKSVRAEAGRVDADQHQLPANGAAIVIGTGIAGTFANGGTKISDAGDTTVKVTVAAGNTPTCTFTNTQNASLAIQKQTVGATASFDYTGTGAGVQASFTRNTSPTNPTNAAAFPITGTQLGDKYVRETLLPGYTLTLISCTANGATIVIGTGSNAGDFAPGATVGFWATHRLLLEAVWNGGTIGGHTFAGTADKTLCGVSLTTAEVLGGFWANIAKTTGNEKRSDIDQARMQLLQQLLAAILNNAAFGSAPTGPITMAVARDNYCNGTQGQIKDAAAAMAAFNESGDSGVFTPGVAANGRDAKNHAEIAFWDRTASKGPHCRVGDRARRPRRTASTLSPDVTVSVGRSPWTRILRRQPQRAAWGSMGYRRFRTTVTVMDVLPDAVANIVCTRGVTNSTVAIGPFRQDLLRNGQDSR